MKTLRKQLTAPSFKAQASSGELVLEVYDVIGGDYFGEGITASNFSQAIDAAGSFSKVTCRINSPGGDLFEGITIYNKLRSLGKPITMIVDGLAGSAASIIFMAGDERQMGDGTMVMIHNAMMAAIGYSTDLRKGADVLDTVSASAADIYVTRTGQGKAEIQKMMDAETWMGTDECLKLGFATAVSKTPADKAVTAKFDLSIFNNVPDSLKKIPAHVAAFAKAFPEATKALLAAFPAAAEITAEVSFQQRIDDVQEALDAKYPAPPNDSAYCYYSGKYWALEVYAASVIVCDIKDSDEYFRIAYTVNDADEVTLGDTLQPVEKTWVPSAAAKVRLSLGRKTVVGKLVIDLETKTVEASTEGDPLIGIYRKRIALARSK